MVEVSRGDGSEGPDLDVEAALRLGDVLRVRVLGHLETHDFAGILDIEQNGLGVRGLDLELDLAPGLVPLVVQRRADDAAGRLLDTGENRLVGSLGVGGREVQVNRLARGDVGQVIEGDQKDAITLFHLRVAGPAGAAFLLLEPVDIEPGDRAELLQAIAQRPGGLRRHLEVEDGAELAGRVLLHLGPGDPALGLGHGGESGAMRLVDVLGLDPHLHALGLDNGVGERISFS